MSPSNQGTQSQGTPSRIPSPRKSLRKTLGTAACLAAVLFVAGCSGMKKEKTAHEQGYQRWNNTRSGILYGLAKQQYEQGNLDAARKSCDDALKLTPNNATIRIMSARLYIEKGHMEPALKELAEAIKSEQAIIAANPEPKPAKNAPANAPKPGNASIAEAEYLTGVIQQRWQKPQQAFEAYSRAVEQSPNELPYVLAKAEMMVILDKRDDALLMLQERMTYFENSGTIRDAIGQLLVQRQQYAEAVQVLRQASILAPDELIIREHLALAMYYNKQHRDAGNLLERVINDARGTPRADLLAALGECQLQLGKFAEARNSFESAAQANPGGLTVWLGLAKAALELNDTKRVELSLKKASALEPANAEVFLMQGYLKLKQKKMPEALSAFRRAYAIDPKDTVGLCMAGYTLEKMGRQSEAMACYAKALKMKPEDDLASTLMAQVQVHE